MAVESARLVPDNLRLLENLKPLPEPAAEPFFVAVSGLPGTGKSYFCRHLAERLPAVLLESDVIRKMLFTKPAYSAEESSYLFQHIHFLVKKLLLKGIPVILDATNLSEKNREYLYSIADHLKVKLILVRVSAPQEIIRQRLQSRKADPLNKSDADWEVYRKMQPAEEKIHRKHYSVDTSQDIFPIIDKIVRQVLR